MMDPHPQYRRYHTPSDMDLTSIEGDPVRQDRQAWSTIEGDRKSSSL